MGYNGTGGRFSKSILVKIERNGLKRPRNKFRVLSTKPRTCKCLVGPVESQGVALAAAFNAGPLPTGLPDVKGEQSLEQLGLAIKMMLAEPTARYLFAAVLK